METKILKVKSLKEKVDNDYKLEVDIPSESELLRLLQLSPANYILSKEPLVFKTGILAQIPHAVKVLISSDHMGLYIKLSQNDYQLDVHDVRGRFAHLSDHNGHGHSNGTGLAIRPFEDHHFIPSRTNAHSHEENSGLPFVFERKEEDEVPKLSGGEVDDFGFYFEAHRSHFASNSKTRVKVVLKLVGSRHIPSVNEDDRLFPEPDGSCSGSWIFNAEPYYNSDFCSDIKLRLGSTLYTCHKLILAARSGYFLELFQAEPELGELELEEDSELFGQLIRFIYLGNVVGMKRIAGELLLLGDKYKIRTLIVTCQEFLVDHCSEENALELYDLSQKIEAKGLASTSKRLILQNKDKFKADSSLASYFEKYPELEGEYC